MARCLAYTCYASIGLLFQIECWIDTIYSFPNLSNSFNTLNDSATPVVPLIAMLTEMVSRISSLVAPDSSALMVWPTMQFTHLALSAIPKAIRRLTLVLSTPSFYTSSHLADS